LTDSAKFLGADTIQSTFLAWMSVMAQPTIGSTTTIGSSGSQCFEFLSRLPAKVLPLDPA
jgi:hypothetical protein